MTDTAIQSEVKHTPIKSTKVYRIGELARLTNATTRTLRYYEELGLLEPVRNTSGQRLYSEESLKRLDYIHQMKSGGFSLNEIKGLFEAWQKNQTGAEAAGATGQLIQNKLVEINKTQKELSRLNNELQTMVSFLVNCQSCEDHPSFETCEKCEVQEMPTPDMLKNILKLRNDNPDHDV
jgi:DNA-binding transcriptional MerR regulator